MADFTPENFEWEAERVTVLYFEPDEDSRFIAYAITDFCLPYQSFNTYAWTADENTARLVAAAPDLYDACLTLINDWGKNLSPAVEKAQRAVKKATGHFPIRETTNG